MGFFVFAMSYLASKNQADAEANETKICNLAALSRTKVRNKVNEAVCNSVELCNKKETVIKKFIVNSHKYKSNTLSSKKNNLAADIQSGIVNTNYTTTNRQYKRNKKKRQHKKTLKINDLPIIKTDDRFTLSASDIQLKKKTLFQGGGKFRPDLKGLPNATTESVFDNFEPYTSENGGILIDKDGTFIALVLPKKDLETHFGKNYNKPLVKVLKELTSVFKTTKRGTERQAYFEKNYANYSIFPTRNCRGLHLSTDSAKLKPHTCASIVNLLKQFEHTLGSWTPSDDFGKIKTAKKTINWPTVCTPDGNVKCDILTGFASAVNYSSFLHVDEDFWLSIFMCNTTTSEVKKNLVATYFCFPSTGRAIGLKPGDCMIFNAMEYHCCSSKTDDFYEDDVYASSSYTKARVVGGNDNSLCK